ncbi:MAG: hypothetical protein ACQES9_06755 [Myxococcota bacterium]
MNKLLWIFVVLLFLLFPVAGSAKKGITSRFSFGFGPQIGFGNQASAGIILSSRFMGVAGVDLEYDFNRVTSTPPSDLLNEKALQFVPNLKLTGIVYFFRKNNYATFASGGIGIDMGSPKNRNNLFGGAGLEFTIMEDQVVLRLGLRFYFPKPVDVEKQRERIIMNNEPTTPAYTEYYNFDTFQFFMSLQIYY